MARPNCDQIGINANFLLASPIDYTIVGTYTSCWLAGPHFFMLSAKAGAEMPGKCSLKILSLYSTSSGYFAFSSGFRCLMASGALHA